MAISRRLRFEILRRDGHTCRYCGAKAPDVQLEVDHVIATTLGGPDEPSNLVTACEDCNSGKSSIAPDSAIVDDVENDALRWAKAIEKAAFYREIDQDATDDLVAEWDDAWSDWTYGPDQKEIPRDKEWRASIETFLSHGLTPQELRRLVRVTMDSRAKPEGKWKFFCGCCWRAISDLQETARHLIESGEV